ncbi:hypothetical protein OG304_38335 [Streptomyces sp. NBC_00160]|uniref:Uncharacterized protein n=1 Tax=Streptomyces spororaveus TaxID=284039 RepID=A0ABQ3T2U6_9ACTN|nr:MULTISPECIES: hypothetical protein [Streptomyces]MCM9077376.1 hypothetical protein [Streptomyces spororaveus]MCM9077385.1 hypothetical protein [Streptomyces spororaveus]MCX5309222.1 hypothetical protein [Streptomyces sp. NBC_00160]GHI74712.1 hypothetical protein Sspor_02730 [Streptomyces spororaveus]GHI82546.1 hypothetical protein Sspor_81070 [Streptomyces spororaveus]
MTRPTVEVLRLLLSAPPHEPLWATGIGEQTGLDSAASASTTSATRPPPCSWNASTSS